MAYRGYLQLGATEIANASRAAAYLDAASCNGTVRVNHDDSWPHTFRWLKQRPYSDPETDGAPWFTTTVPESADFLGIWPMSVEGLDSTILDRDVLESAGSGAVFGVPHAKARKVKVEALVLGATPAGGEYGLQWLNAVLRADGCNPFDQPRNLTYLGVAPEVSIDTTDDQVVSLGQSQVRKLYSVACTGQVQVKQRFGLYPPERRQATCFRVEFELTAGNPFVWRNEVALTTPVQLSTGATQTVQFERQVNGVCPSECPPESPPLYDPGLPTPSPLPRPLTPASAVGCQQVQMKRTKILVPSTKIRQFEQVVPTVVVQTGAQAERSIRIQWVRGRDTADLQCGSIGEVMVGYVPPNSFLTLDGVSGQAYCQTGSAAPVDATPVVSGRLGGPWRAPVLRCGSEHTVVLDAATTVAAATQVVITGQTRSA